MTKRSDTQSPTQRNSQHKLSETRADLLGRRWILLPWRRRRRRQGGPAPIQEVRADLRKFMLIPVFLLRILPRQVMRAAGAGWGAEVVHHWFEEAFRRFRPLGAVFGPPGRRKSIQVETLHRMDPGRGPGPG